MLRAELVAEKAKSEDQTTLTLTLTHELRLQVRNMSPIRARGRYAWYTRRVRDA